MKSPHALKLVLIFVLASFLHPVWAAPVPDMSALLSRTYMDGTLLLRHVGQVEVDRREGRIALRIDHDPCGELTARPGTELCQAIPQNLETLWVPLKSVDVDCGSVIYRGTRDGVSRGQAFIDIEVIDHSARHCADQVRAQWEVNAAIIDVSAHETKSYVLLN